MNSQTSICNLALAYLGQPPISSLEQDNEQARWLKLFYNPVREEVLLTHDWGFAAAQKTLTLVQNPTSSQGEFLYKYPADALFIRCIFSQNAPQTPVSFEQRFDVDRHMRLLSTPAVRAVARYTRRITDETQYDPAFVKCFALALACDCALALTGDIDLSARLQQKYTLCLEEAKRANMTETWVRSPQTDTFSEVR
ncbi:MAG: hypothetical protein J6Y17_03310 [Elusimicrobiaceae bacterium]|nr:hypothetical protein [Elusimicrobiaceae bacterium]